VKATGPDVKEGTQETATEVLKTDAKEEIMLRVITDWAQDSENRLTNLLGRFFYPTFGEASVSYGTRYTLKTANELRLEYETARKQGLAESVKDDAYADYIESKYESDAIQREIQYKLLRIEPFFHYSLMDIKAVTQDPEIIKRKMYFGEWKRTKTDMELFALPDVKLLADFDTYLAGKQINEPEPAKPAFQ
jgi:hypothetical protein